MTGVDQMDRHDRQAMMKSMMEQCCGGMSAEEKKEMCATMVGKMTEGHCQTNLSRAGEGCRSEALSPPADAILPGQWNGSA
jgi:hypothetical protein